jgi:alpha-D-xyloside xylohydrolase
VSIPLAHVESPDWGRLAAVAISGEPSTRADGAVLVPTTAGPLVLSLHAAGLRIQGGPPVRDYGLIVEPPRLLDAIVRPERAPDGARTLISAADWRLELDHSPFAFALRRGETIVQASPTDAHFVRRFRLPPLARTESGWFVSLDLRPASRVYGLGEKWGRLDRRGQLVRSFNRDALGVNAEWSYKNVPFAWSPDGWSAFVHTACPVTHGVGFAPWSERAYALVIDDASLDLFLDAGADGAALLDVHTRRTGRAPVPPLWSLGAILSKAYYRDAEEIVAAARAVRARGMPCDTITFDGRAWQDTDTRFAFEWDPKRYPDPRPVIAALKALDFRVCVWEYPLVSVKNPLFAELAAKGWLLRDERTGEAYRYEWDLEPFGQVLTPLPASGLVDFTHPDAYAWWRDRHRELFELGVDMLKPDFGEQVEPHMLASDGSRGDALHNVYALLYNRCVYEAAQRYARDGAFLFSRAAWTGSQRYPSQWGGDPQADWGGLAASLRGGLSWGMTGAPYYATDVGGFYGDRRDAELYVRWLQVAVFGAHLRLHGIGPREPWSYGPDAEAAARAALELRYRLLPYLHRACMQASTTGLPVQRAMPLALPREPESWAFDHQFFCGDDLLVAACVEAGGAVEVYLPHGDWARFPGGERVAGGRCLSLRLALGETAAFARSGARIPLGPVVPHTGGLGPEPRIQSTWVAA